MNKKDKIEIIKRELDNETIISAYSDYKGKYSDQTPMDFNKLCEIETGYYQWDYSKQKRARSLKRLFELNATDTKDTYYYYSNHRIYKVIGTDKTADYCLKNGGEGFIKHLAYYYRLYEIGRYNYNELIEDRLKGRY